MIAFIRSHHSSHCTKTGEVSGNENCQPAGSVAVFGVNSRRVFTGRHTAKSPSNMYVRVLEFVELMGKTESTKPHPIKQIHSAQC